MNKKGKIIWYNEFKGYGFVEDIDGNRYFLHDKSIEKKINKDSLTAGASIKFKAAKDKIEVGQESFLEITDIDFV